VLTAKWAVSRRGRYPGRARGGPGPAEEAPRRRSQVGAQTTARVARRAREVAAPAPAAALSAGAQRRGACQTVGGAAADRQRAAFAGGWGGSRQLAGPRAHVWCVVCRRFSYSGISVSCLPTSTLRLRLWQGQTAHAKNSASTAIAKLAVVTRTCVYTVECVH
jgi:hypothetical protein